MTYRRMRRAHSLNWCSKYQQGWECVRRGWGWKKILRRERGMGASKQTRKYNYIKWSLHKLRARLILDTCFVFYYNLCKWCSFMTLRKEIPFSLAIVLVISQFLYCEEFTYFFIDILIYFLYSENEKREWES